MKKLILIALLVFPTSLCAATLDLTFSVEDVIDKGVVILTLTDNLGFFYEEARNSEKGTIETVKGVTFSFSFDIKKGVN